MKGYVFILLAAVCWGTLGPVARLAFQEGISPLEVALWRAIGGSLCFLFHAGLSRALHIQRRDIIPVAAFGVVGVGLFYSSYQMAVDEGGAALASVLLYTAPAWVALLAWSGLGEKMTAGKLLAIGLTLGGIVAIARSGGGPVRWTSSAIGWGLVAGWSYALYYPFGKRYFSRYAPAAIFAFALPVGTVVLAPFVDFAPKSILAWFALVWIALISTYVAYLFYGHGLRRIEATRASIVATLEPVIAAVLAYMWWDERMGLWGYAGAALILTGVIVSVLDRKKLSDRSDQVKPA